MNRHPAHILLLKAARALELLIAAVILLVIVCGAVFLFRETGRTLLLSPEAFALGDFLSAISVRNAVIRFPSFSVRNLPHLFE